MVGNWKMIQLTPFVMLKGYSIAMQASFFIGYFLLLLETSIDSNGKEMKNYSQEEKQKIALYCYVPMGIGQMIGPLFLGLIQDKCGHIASLVFIQVNLVTEVTLLFVLNETGQYDPIMAWITMFIYGMTDNSVSTYSNVAVGFEFTNKLVAFGTKLFLESIGISICLVGYSLKPPETKEAFRGILIGYVVLGLSATLIVMRIARHFK